MKKTALIIVFISFLLACGNEPKEKAETNLEKEEMEKVETMQKTDQEKEDSVLAKWQKKMGETEVKEEE